MNIFKVIASGKKPFFEEQMSSVLAWLLHPQMEHGLGKELLERFLKECGVDARIRQGFRSGDYADNVRCELERSVDGAFIDIVYAVGDLVIAIENKIYEGSVTEGQLQREYDGLRKQIDDETIIMAYVTPDEMCARQEFNNLRLPDLAPEQSQGGDYKVLLTWETTICNIIESLLTDEASGRIEPVPEYTRHTLKALLAFIRNGFSGYDFERKTYGGAQNPLTEGRLTPAEIKQKSGGFVGVAHGLSGLLAFSRAELEAYSFQFTESDMMNRTNWISISDFNAIADWILYNSPIQYDWDVKLNAALIQKIASSSSANKIYVGIQGGENALRGMDADTISAKGWRISTTKKTSQWIDGDTFSEILTSKGFK